MKITPSFLLLTFDDSGSNLVFDLVEDVLDAVGGVDDIGDADVLLGLDLGCRGGGGQRGQGHEAEETKNSHDWKMFLCGDDCLDYKATAN